jgi:hypothetical protein
MLEVQYLQQRTVVVAARVARWYIYIQKSQFRLI